MAGGKLLEEVGERDGVQEEGSGGEEKGDVDALVQGGGRE